MTISQRKERRVEAIFNLQEVQAMEQVASNFNLTVTRLRKAEQAYSDRSDGIALVPPDSALVELRGLGDEDGFSNFWKAVGEERRRGRIA